MDFKKSKGDKIKKKKTQVKHEGADSPSLPSVSLLIRGPDDERISDGKDEGEVGKGDEGVE